MQSSSILFFGSFQSSFLHSHSLKHPGWDPITGKLSCSNEWWDRKIKEKPEAKKFRNKSIDPSIEEYWNQLFDDSYASGEEVVAPSVNSDFVEPVEHFNGGEEDKESDGKDNHHYESGTQVSKQGVRGTQVPTQSIRDTQVPNQGIGDTQVPSPVESTNRVEQTQNMANKPIKFCEDLQTKYGLQPSRRVTVVEKVGIFVYTLAMGASNRDVRERFQHFGETISRVFHEVLEDCIGYIDGTHIAACILEADQMRYRGRKGISTFNVMTCCDFDMCFTFISVVWEGSAHDTRVFFHAINTPVLNFPKPPEGRYYLVNKRYPDREGYLVPYPKIRANSQDDAMFNVLDQHPNYVPHDAFRDTADNSQDSERPEGGGGHGDQIR
ncbi:uncharacterized protein LOC131620071 [Vicia villosa]|uniref:uncharacterized protein LOC131620071 n=1 Tax=Vicia villosa TaxID=3911 RepID=UPI00273B0FFB|nr:uncharacterized protein LOC131620071 [Vicia villosa]